MICWKGGAPVNCVIEGLSAGGVSSIKTGSATCPTMKNTLLFVRALPPVIMLGTAGFAAGAAGDPDTSFGTGGGTVSSFSAGEDTAYALAVQSDGKIVVVGDASVDDFAILRLNGDGTPDTTFGGAGTGKKIIDFGHIEQARGVAIQTDGKIIVGGAGVPGGTSRDFAVVRCLSGGGLDPAFNGGSVVTTDIQGGNVFNDQVYAMAVQTDGKIILGGSSRTNIAMVRYMTDGTLDSGFGTGGKVFTAGSTATEQQINALAVMSDGRIVAAGQSRTGANTDVLVARFLSNGTPDPNFGTGGKTVSPVGAVNISDVGNAVAVLADGKVLVAGTSNGDLLILRYTSGGVLDTPFGGDGFGGKLAGYQNGTENGTGVVVQTDGSIILTGTTGFGGRDYFTAFRFSSAGVLDSTFGSGGGFAIGLTAGTDAAWTAKLQSDGKLLMAGVAGTGATRDFGVARFETTGPLTLPAWRLQYFGNSANSGSGSNASDPETDGTVNLLEYAFGTNPIVHGPPVRPSVQVSGGNLTSTFTAPSYVTGITYAAEWSTALTAGTWQSVADSGSGRVHTFSLPTAGKTKLYLRWRVSEP